MEQLIDADATVFESGWCDLRNQTLWDREPLVQSLRFHMWRRGRGKNAILAIDNQLAALGQNDFPYAVLEHLEVSATVEVNDSVRFRTAVRNRTCELRERTSQSHPTPMSWNGAVLETSEVVRMPEQR